MIFSKQCKTILITVKNNTETNQTDQIKQC